MKDDWIVFDLTEAELLDRQIRDAECALEGAANYLANLRAAPSARTAEGCTQRRDQAPSRAHR